MVVSSNAIIVILIRNIFYIPLEIRDDLKGLNGTFRRVIMYGKECMVRDWHDNNVHGMITK